MPDTRQASPGDILVWGGYGWGNTGDDLTLAIAMQDLQQAQERRVRVITPNVEHTQLAQPNTCLIAAPTNPPHRIVDRWIWWMAYQALARGKEARANQLERWVLGLQRRRCTDTRGHDVFATASVLHLVGGGYLTDRFDLQQFLHPVQLARAMNLAITTSPLGIGPFASTRAGQAVALALRGASIKVRDSDSLEFCRKHHLEAGEYPDDGFRLNEVVPACKTDTAHKGLPRRIGVCVFPQYGDALTDTVDQWWVDCLGLISKKLPDWKIEGFCFHTEPSMDFQTTRKLFERSGLNPQAVHPPEPDYRKAVMLLNRFDGIISTRFHAVVAASTLRIPSVAVGMNDYYAIKMRCALKHASSPALQIAPRQDSAQAVWQFLSRHLEQTPTPEIA